LIHLQYETRKEYGDVLLAPSTIGEIAIININGSTEYAMRRDAFLAKTSRVSVNLGFSGLKGKETVICANVNGDREAHLEKVDI
jgi:uncharacterized protein (AIM24 family)